MLATLALTTALAFTPTGGYTVHDNCGTANDYVTVTGDYWVGYGQARGEAKTWGVSYPLTADPNGNRESAGEGTFTDEPCPASTQAPAPVKTAEPAPTKTTIPTKSTTPKAGSTPAKYTPVRTPPTRTSTTRNEPPAGPSAEPAAPESTDETTPTIPPTSAPTATESAMPTPMATIDPSTESDRHGAALGWAGFAIAITAGVAGGAGYMARRRRDA